MVSFADDAVTIEVSRVSRLKATIRHHPSPPHNLVTIEVSRVSRLKGFLYYDFIHS